MHHRWRFLNCSLTCTRRRRWRWQRKREGRVRALLLPWSHFIIKCQATAAAEANAAAAAQQLSERRQRSSITRASELVFQMVATPAKTIVNWFCQRHLATTVELGNNNNCWEGVRKRGRSSMCCCLSLCLSLQISVVVPCSLFPLFLSLALHNGSQREQTKQNCQSNANLAMCNE